MGRTVVLHPGALGDVLLATPALRALAAAGDELVLAAQPRIGDLLVALGVVDRALAFDTLGLDTLFGPAMPPPRLQRLLRGARVVSWFGAADPHFVRRLRALSPGAVVASSRPAPGEDVWRHLLASVGVSSVDAFRRPIPIPPALLTEGGRALGARVAGGGRPIVMLHPGAGGAGKRWAVEGFAAVARGLAGSADVVVHEGPADAEAVAALSMRLGGEVATVADPPLPALAGALGHVALWIGNDSGVSHLASAVGAPAVVLLQRRNLAWRPWASAAVTRVVSPEAPLPAEVDDVLAEASALLGAAERVR